MLYFIKDLKNLHNSIQEKCDQKNMDFIDLHQKLSMVEWNLKWTFNERKPQWQCMVENFKTHMLQLIDLKFKNFEILLNIELNKINHSYHNQHKTINHNSFTSCLIKALTQVYRLNLPNVKNLYHKLKIPMKDLDKDT